MNDRDIMENLLLTVKGASDLYLHGTLESSAQPVHTAFNSALEDTLCMQDQIYKKMSAKGWYPSEQADQNQMNAVRQKFAMAL